MRCFFEPEGADDVSHWLNRHLAAAGCSDLEKAVRKSRKIKVELSFFLFDYAAKIDINTEPQSQLIKK